MNNNKNNIPSNIPGNMQTIDYYNDLKSIKKEIEEKIYKQLSKDESFSEILDNIKNNFINTNLSIIEDNLSKSDLTNYKGFNGKLINILEILENILTNYASSNKIDDKRIKESFNKTDYINTLEENQIPPPRLTPEELSIRVGIKIADFLKSLPDAEKTDEKYLKIVEYIYTFKYYIATLRENDKRGEFLDAKIKELNDSIPQFKNNAQNALQQRNVIKDGKTPQQLLSDAVEELKKYHEEYKKFYKELCNYVRIYIYDIFDIVKNREEKLLSNISISPSDDKAKIKEAKEATANYEKYMQDFKKEIYYNVINIINTPSTDDFVALQDSNNEKIDLESRKKLLTEMKELLDAQLKKLNDVINFLITSNKQEYIDEIKGIKNIFKDYVKEKEYKDPILALIVSEENEVVKLLAKNAEKIKNYTERTKMKKQSGGERKTNKYYEEKYVNINKLKENIEKLIKKIKETEGLEDNNDPFENKDNNNMMFDPNNGIFSIYKNIWNDYVKETKKNKAKGVNIETLKSDDRLYERFNENNLDPTEVLKITFQDKVIFICIILIIRTFAMVLIEFLIEYDFISTLYRGILVYSALYILLIILCTIVINYDSYKLRILVNYLNLHINSSNIYFHILLFALFNGLILIIINNNDLKNIDNVFNYTYIYKYIFEIADKSSTDSELRLSQKNKIMLQYRMDIITMIIFIFTALLILII